MTYLWLKALHIIAVICWFAGLFYLPRLFVYHASSDDQVSHEYYAPFHGCHCYFCRQHAVYESSVTQNAMDAYKNHPWLLADCLSLFTGHVSQTLCHPS